MKRSRPDAKSQKKRRPDGFGGAPCTQVVSARVVKAGKDITLIGISRMTWVCTEAAEELAKEGVDAEVIDLMSVSPIHYDLLVDSVRRTHRLVVVDEDTPRCSVATDICAVVTEEAFDHLDAPPLRVQAPHTPVPYSKPLEGAYIPNVPRVVAAVRRALGRG